MELHGQTLRRVRTRRAQRFRKEDRVIILGTLEREIDEKEVLVIEKEVLVIEKKVLVIEKEVMIEKEVLVIEKEVLVIEKEVTRRALLGKEWFRKEAQAVRLEKQKEILVIETEGWTTPVQFSPQLEEVAVQGDYLDILLGTRKVYHRV